MRRALLVAVLRARSRSAALVGRRRRRSARLPPAGRRPRRRSVPAARHAFGPGNRGLEYGTEPGTPVAAAADGRVIFAGLGGRHPARHRAARRRRCAPPTRSCGASTWSSASGSARATRSGDRRPPPLRCPSGRQLLRPGVAVRHGPAAGAPGALRRTPGRRRGGRAERHRPADRRRGAPARRRRLAPPGRSAPGCGTAGPSCCAPSTTTAERFTFPASFVDSWSTVFQAWQRARSRAPTGRARRRAIRPTTVGPTGRRARRRPRLRQRAAPPSTRSHRRARVRRRRRPALQLRGRRVPDPTDGFATIPVSDYGAADTQDDLRVAGRRLADLLEQVAARGAGRADRRHRPLPGRCGGPPGADRARASGTARRGSTGSGCRHPRHAARRRRPGDRDPRAVAAPRPATSVLDVVGAGHRPGARRRRPSIAQLGETSDVVAELADHPVPDVDRRRVDRRPRRPDRARAAQPGARAWTRWSSR